MEVSGQGQGRPQPDLTRRWPASKVPLDLDSLKLSIPSVDHCTEYLVSFLKLLDPSSLSFASFESPTGGGLKFPALSLGENALSRWTRLSSVTLGDPSTSGERRSVHFPVAGRAYYDKLPRAMIEEVPHSSTRSLVVHYFASVSPETAPADVKALCARLEKTLFRRDVTLKITFSRVQDMKAYVAAWETTTLGQMLGTGGFEVVPGLVNDVVPCVDGDTSQSATSGTTDSEGTSLFTLATDGIGLNPGFPIRSEARHLKQSHRGLHKSSSPLRHRKNLPRLPPRHSPTRSLPSHPLLAITDSPAFAACAFLLATHPSLSSASSRHQAGSMPARCG